MIYKIDALNTHYSLSEDNITRASYNGDQTSHGFLIHDYFDSIIKALSAALFLREGKCRESISSSKHVEDEQDATPLESVLSSLEHSINMFTNGEYERFVSANTAGDRSYDYKYYTELQDIWFEIKQLREGRYYEHPLYGHRGIARISTTGGKLVDKIMDLVWRLDDNAPGAQEEMDAFMRHIELFDDQDDLNVADDSIILGNSKP